jgi:hypothetical protein
MNVEIGKKWINSLRSGEYEQGMGALRINDKYCCLGVLCDLYSKEHNVPWKKDIEEGVYLFNKCTAYLPKKVKTWAGMKSFAGLLSSREMTSLTYLNDVHKMSFEEIADLIEKNIERL